MGDPMPVVRKEPEVTKVETEAGQQRVEEIPDYASMHQFLLDDQEWLNVLQDTRGWSQELVERMKIGIGLRGIDMGGGVWEDLGCWVYPYIVRGKCQFVKFRTLPGVVEDQPGFRGFSSLIGRPVPLYNQDAVKKDMDYLLLVEGEPDTISVLGLGEENVVGVPGATQKSVTYSDLLKFPKKKYLLFDNDEAGQTGAHEFAKRFGIEEFWNIVLPEFDLAEPIIDEDGNERTKGKDITEWIQAGHTLDDLKQLMAEAQQFNIEGAWTEMQASITLEKELIERGNNEPKFISPWPDLNKAFGGLDAKELLIVQAPQKTGKTSLALNWADFITTRNKVPVLFECLEMPETKLARKMAAYRTNTDDTPGKLSFQELLDMNRRNREIISGREAPVIFGYTSVNNLDEEFERLRALIRRHGAEFVIFDNLQFLVDKVYQGERQGGRPSFISKASKMFKSLAMDTGASVLLIQQTKGLDEDSMATSKTGEGSSAPGNDCDVMMIMNRTKQLSITKKSELSKFAEQKTNVISTSTLNPELYIDVGLSRYAPGGTVILMLDGARSLVHSREEKDVRITELGEGEKQIGGTRVKTKRTPPKPAPQICETQTLRMQASLPVDVTNDVDAVPVPEEVEEVIEP